RRIESAVHHPLRHAVTRQRLGRAFTRHGYRIADVHLSQRLDIADEIAHLAGAQLFASAPLRHELPELEHFVIDAGLKEANSLPFAHYAAHNAHISDRSAIFVIVRIEYHRLQWRVRIA